MGGGAAIDPSLQKGPDYPTKDLLDTVSTEHPVFVYNASLHLAYCNSLALNIAVLMLIQKIRQTPN